VDIGAADAGVAHADQNIVDAYLRLGYIFEPEAALGATFYQGLHCSHFLSCST
jgi:hypothetical protein